MVKKATHNLKPLKMLEVGDLCYRREFDGKKPVKIKDLCEVIKVRKRGGESYYIKDLESERIYLRNRSWIQPCDKALIKIHKAKILSIICDQSTSHKMTDGSISNTQVEIPESCMRTNSSKPQSKRVKFDNTIVLARCELRAWRSLP